MISSSQEAEEGFRPRTLDEESILAEEDLVAVYAASTDLEADRLLKVLADNGIEAILRESASSSFPASSDDRHAIVVAAHVQERSRALIEEAVRDGVVSAGGASLR